MFIGIEMDEETKEKLVVLQEKLLRSGFNGMPVPKENLHLTLAFIGEYPDAEKVLDVLEEVAFTPFDLEGIGNFGDLFWAGVSQNDTLLQLSGRIRRALADQDIPFDRKSFHPHVTLLRKVSLAEGYFMPEEETIHMHADHVTLFHSRQGKHGMIYTEIGSIISDKGEIECVL